MKETLLRCLKIINTQICPAYNFDCWSVYLSLFITDVIHCDIISGLY